MISRFTFIDSAHQSSEKYEDTSRHRQRARLNLRKYSLVMLHKVVCISWQVIQVGEISYHFFWHGTHIRNTDYWSTMLFKFPQNNLLLSLSAPGLSQGPWCRHCSITYCATRLPLLNAKVSLPRLAIHEANCKLEQKLGRST